MKGLKNLSLFISILVIFFAILIILSFFGNPISKGVVKVKAYNYLKENCSDYEAKSIEIVYDLVNSSYLVNVYDSGSEEIEFTLVYNYFGCFKKKVSRNISLNKESVAIHAFSICKAKIMSIINPINIKKFNASVNSPLYEQIDRKNSIYFAKTY